MSYIDVMIPMSIGLLLIFFPKAFTKSTGLTFEQAKQKFRNIGFVLIGVGLIYLSIKLFG